MTFFVNYGSIFESAWKSTSFLCPSQEFIVISPCQNRTHHTKIYEKNILAFLHALLTFLRYAFLFVLKLMNFTNTKDCGFSSRPWTGHSYRVFIITSKWLEDLYQGMRFKKAVRVIQSDKPSVYGLNDHFRSQYCRVVSYLWLHVPDLCMTLGSLLLQAAILNTHNLSKKKHQIDFVQKLTSKNVNVIWYAPDVLEYHLIKSKLSNLRIS